MQKRHARTVHLSDFEYEGLCHVARRRGLEPGVLARYAINRFVKVARAQAEEEASLEALGSGL